MTQGEVDTAYELAAQQAAARVSSASRRAQLSTLQPHSTIDVAAVFAAIEAIRLPGVHVFNVVLDTDEGYARAEVKLADPTQVGTVLEQMQRGGGKSIKWSFASLQADHAGARVLLAVETNQDTHRQDGRTAPRADAVEPHQVQGGLAR